MNRKRQFCWLVGVLLATAAIALTITKPSTPEGRYVASPYIGAVGDFYWEFKEGKLFFVCHVYKNVESGFADTTYREAERGTYRKIKDGWFWFTDSNSVPPSRIECSWFGLRVSGPDGRSEFYRRRLIPGSRPEWMFDRLPWCIQ